MPGALSGEGIDGGAIHFHEISRGVHVDQRAQNDFGMLRQSRIWVSDDHAMTGHLTGSLAGEERERGWDSESLQRPTLIIRLREVRIAVS